MIFLLTFIITCFSIFFLDKEIAIHFSERYATALQTNYLYYFLSPEKIHGIAKFITKFGEGYFPGILFVIFLFNKKYNKYASGIFYSFMFSGLTVIILKYIFGRERPYYDWNPLHINGIIHNINNGNIFKSIFESFPSGHTITIFALIGFLITKVPIKKNIKFLIIILGILVGFSRIILSYHWFSDVFMGGVLGFYIGRQVGLFSSPMDWFENIKSNHLLNYQLKKSLKNH